MPSRRDVLAAMTLGGATALAGCAGTLTDGAADRDTSEDWPQFRADAANTGANRDARGPVDDPEIDWVHLGPSWYDMLEPVVADALYTVNDGITALTPTTGDVEWQADGGIYDHTPALSSDLLVPERRLRAVARDGGRTALGRRFEFERWETTTSVDSSLTLADGTVLFGGRGDTDTYSGRVTAADATTGEARWSTTTASPVTGAPASDGQRVYAATEGADTTPRLLALDVADGNEVWSHPLDSRASGTVPVVGDGLVYVQRSDVLRAVDIATGDPVWSFTPDGEGRVTAPPALAQGTLYVPTNAESDGLVALDATTGERLWTAGNGPYWCSPSVGDDGIYAVDADGRLALHWRDGPEQWHHRVDAPVSSSPIPSGGRVFVGTRDGLLYALGDRE